MPAPATYKNITLWSIVVVLIVALVTTGFFLYAHTQKIEVYKKTVTRLENELVSLKAEAQPAPLVENTHNTLDLNERKMSFDRNISFDGCGSLSQYENAEWYPHLAQHTTIAIKPGIKLPEIDASLQDVSDACFSENGNLLLMLFPGGYGGGPTIYTFNTETYELERATLIDHGRGWLASPQKFGKRESNIITLEGTSGDAGAGSTMYYHYYFFDNVIELQKAYQFSSENPDQGMWYFY